MSITKRPQDVAFRPERVRIDAPAGLHRDCPETATDTDGTVVACAFDAGHSQPCRFIRLAVEPTHVCGLCGEEFEIADTDPHWSTGRGPICPWIEGLRQACRAWSGHVTRARLDPWREASPVQARLHASDIVRHGQSVAVMLMQQWIAGWSGDAIDLVVEDVLLACWTT